MKLVLASASPRRAELLRNAGLAFRVEVPNLEEATEPGEAPDAYARRLARDKARVVAARCPGELVLAADTIVVAGDHLLEKPRDPADAARMLRLLSGRTHEVTTGVCLLLLETGNEKPETVFEDVRSETTQVTFAPLTDEEIQAYVATGQTMDKAGAYGIQEFASRFVTRVEGCYFNVVGLPVRLVYRMLREHGAV
ncbi:MAG TPA: Maf family protein [Terriglobales bacterium]|nr:Maf family protein [Terriglobales bacterium]